MDHFSHRLGFFMSVVHHFGGGHLGCTTPVAGTPGAFVFGTATSASTDFEFMRAKTTSATDSGVIDRCPFIRAASISFCITVGFIWCGVMTGDRVVGAAAACDPEEPVPADLSNELCDAVGQPDTTSCAPIAFASAPESFPMLALCIASNLLSASSEAVTDFP